MPRKIAIQARRFALGAWLLLVLACVFGFIRLESLSSTATRLGRENARLNQQNHQRILDIQRSRLESCQTTYDSFHVIFDPFLPPRNKRNAEERARIAKFNAILARKKHECGKQVTPPPVPGQKGVGK